MDSEASLALELVHLTTMLRKFPEASWAHPSLTHLESRILTIPKNPPSYSLLYCVPRTVLIILYLLTHNPPKNPRGQHYDPPFCR